MTAPIAYHNGRFVPAVGLSVPVQDGGFVWGATVTDRLRTFNGRLFRLADHLSRFRTSCELARVPLPVSDGELAAASERLVTENRGGEDVSLVWLATPGSMPGFAPDPGPVPDGSTLIAYTLPLDPTRFDRLRRQGARLVTVRAALGVDPRVKHRSRLPWWVAGQSVRAQDPDAEPLFADPDTVLETPTANVLAVFDKVLISPPADRILPGISLSTAADLCPPLGLSLVYRPLPRADLLRASEVLLTNTSYCVGGVSRVDGQSIPFPGPILAQLLDAWSDFAGLDVGRQRASGC